jgi:hypothetical protein
MNDHGLWFDGFAVSLVRPDMTLPYYRGDLVKDVLAKSATVDEVVRLFSRYNRAFLKEAVLMFADASGTGGPRIDAATGSGEADGRRDRHSRRLQHMWRGEPTARRRSRRTCAIDSASSCQAHAGRWTGWSLTPSIRILRWCFSQESAARPRRRRWRCAGSSPGLLPSISTQLASRQSAYPSDETTSADYPEKIGPPGRCLC